MDRKLAGIAALALVLLAPTGDGRAGDGAPEITRADLSLRVARCEAALFGRVPDGLPEAALLDAVDREYGRCSIDWSLGRGRAACEDLSRAAAIADGVTYGADVALSSALEVRAEPRVVSPSAGMASPSTVITVEVRSLYVPAGVTPGALVVVYVLVDAHDGDVVLNREHRGVVARAGDLEREGVRLRVFLREEERHPTGRLVEVTAWATLAPSSVDCRPGAEVATFTWTRPPDARAAKAYLEVVPDARARFERAHEAVLSGAADPGPRQASHEWALHRLAFALGEPAEPGPPVEGPVAFGAELTRLERDLAGEPPPPPERRPTLTVEALRDPRGLLVPYTLYVPWRAREAIDAGRPVPLVVALHGIHSSEFTFLEAYGGGRIQRLVEERGWALACPRLGADGAGPPRGEGASAAEVPVGCVEAVARLLAVDPARVFVVGHSMGAMIAADAIAARPGVFRAAALIGGASPLGSKAALARTPALVAWGARDPLAFGGRLLALDLERLHAARLETLEVPRCGHVMSVALALDRAFALFDEAGG